MMTEQQIQEMVDSAVARCNAELEASRRPTVPTPDEEIATRLNEARFREQVADVALACGVRPSAIRHVVRDAATAFEMKDGLLVARGGATDPSDPLTPLTPARWLAQLAETDGYLFVVPRRHEA